MHGNRRLTFFFLLFFAASAAAAAQLTVKVEGKGYVDSYPAGILCGAACQESYDGGTVMTLTAHASEGATFWGWEGCDESNGLQCTLTLSADATVVARFSGPVVSEYWLRVSRAGNGVGKIQSDDGTIFCGSLCTYDEARFAGGTRVTLTATPNPGSEFVEWQGDCAGAETSCTLVVDADKTVAGVFASGDAAEEEVAPQAPAPQPAPKAPQTEPFKRPTVEEREQPKACVYVDGKCVSPPEGGAKPAPKPVELPQPGDYPLAVTVGGGGRVVSADKRIDCAGGNTCEAGYARNATIPLTAVPAAGYAFTRWGDACRGTEMECMAAIESPASFVATTRVKAWFEPKLHSFKVSVEGPGKVKSSDYRTSCGPYCAASVPTDTWVYLEAVPAGTAAFNERVVGGVVQPFQSPDPDTDPSTFVEWEGDCSGSHPLCTIVVTGDVSVTAKFRGPPPRPVLTVAVQGNGKDKFELDMWDAKAKQWKKVECTAECRYTLTQGSIIQVIPWPDARRRFDGYGGACLSTSTEFTCVVTVDADKQVTGSFSARDFKTLTVIKPLLGEVISWTTVRPSPGGGISTGDDKIRCGSSCSAEYDSFYTVYLRFKAGEEGVFVSGCDEIVQSLGITLCAVDLSKGDRVVETRLSAKQEEQIVRVALLAVFDKSYCPDAKPLLEGGAPLHRALAEYRTGRTGKTIEDVKAWLAGQPATWRSETGIQGAFDGCDARIVREALLAVFAAERQQAPALTDFLQDPGKPPMTCGLETARAIPESEGGVPAFSGQAAKKKNHFLDACGVRAFLEKIRQEEEARKREEEAARRREAERTPAIHSISPYGRQIGNQTIIRGNNFVNVDAVLLDGIPQRADVKSDTETWLPDLAWGVDRRGRTPNSPGRVMVRLSNGKTAEAGLFSPSETVIFHAEGKKEACFGGVGKGCSGGGDEWQWPWGSDKIVAPVGCLPERNGYRECWVVPGSIRHDNCCVRHPSGDMCGGTFQTTDGKPAEEHNHNGYCVEEWKAAWWDVFWHRAWKYNFPVNAPPDLTPVQSSRYPEGETVTTIGLCAPSEHEMRQWEDEGFCCSKRFRKGWFGEDTKICA